ncbi:acetolactate synthase large subunit [Pseudonocardia asaccharolytica]|uniref:Acetolactate synthase I/II/III large subunit n=1 Tax=Pseudonocardia asaccharolytica DSM 44247 = NBRC 16224 TaxID=1123024 RepID=A0A511D8H0_9PSEU|nr:acetolactate synthase large subunit [Pseudonocardia asaccharolytica]GEL20713.1 acetolactate synthase I/II/III large subunit [Pseudonocardia asaccharolytica DSM 44247 = NBRC 16224]
MNGARALIQTLVDGGVEVCFANPGTSEMHVVAALDAVPRMRGVLTLFEGVATGAADGYARMADRPAATLLHLGPGLGNGLANLHNARRAGTPVVNIVGDHATFHKRYDAPLDSDLDAIAGTVSGWVRRCASSAEIGQDVAAAIAAATGPPGRVATLILPADVSWADAAADAVGAPPGAVPAARRLRDTPGTGAVDTAAKALGSGEPCLVLIGGEATRERGLHAAARIAAATGARLLSETFPTRMERGAGLPPVARLGYLADLAVHQLTGIRHLILAGAKRPVTFFGYPDKPSDLVPDGCQVHEVAPRDGAATAALEALADLVASDVRAPDATGSRPALPTGTLTADSAAAVVGALLPEGAIVVDEAITSGTGLAAATAGAPRHDWLTLTGGAIGYGLPAATGAALACPDRPVWCLQADGSAMYTISALWTQAREGLDVTTVLYQNSAYAILRLELTRVGAAAGGERARALFDLGDPRLDFVQIAGGMGVPAVRAGAAEELAAALHRAMAEPGPHLIEAVVPALVT